MASAWPGFNSPQKPSECFPGRCPHPSYSNSAAEGSRLRDKRASSRPGCVHSDFSLPTLCLFPPLSGRRACSRSELRPGQQAGRESCGHRGGAHGDVSVASWGRGTHGDIFPGGSWMIRLFQEGGQKGYTHAH